MPRGLGQLTLVEHALCPLDNRSAAVCNLVHETSYRFTDENRHIRRASAKVVSPIGLTVHDEFYLWGLLALTMSQRELDPEFFATPHFCLRQLHVIDQNVSRGGQQYQQFVKAVERLSLVRYQSDQFYDPIRAERRKVSFGFFSFTMPVDLESSRAWRFSWDRIFFEIVAGAGGSFRFDLSLYREFDPACRRFFLLLCKIFHRRNTTPRFSLRDLAVNVLGFADSVAARDLKQKVGRCLIRLADMNIIEPVESPGCFQKQGPGEYTFVLIRGKYFGHKAKLSFSGLAMESPFDEPLKKIGFEERAIQWLHRTYGAAHLREWIDITLAAQERFGRSFFRKNPQAYLLDNLKMASQAGRQPPDWWHELRKQEQRHRSEKRPASGPARFLSGLGVESRESYERIRQEIFDQFVAAGQTDLVAGQNAEKFAREYVRQNTSAGTAPGS